jgi:hypothetical protein
VRPKAAEDHSKIVGLDLTVVALCGKRIGPTKNNKDQGRASRWCQSPLRRVCLHSSRSQKLVWRCPQCRTRYEAVGEEHIAVLGAFVAIHGWQVRPLRIIDGVAHV